MLLAIATLVAAQLLGEVLRRLLHLPLPGPVIGMLMTASVLTVSTSLRGRPPSDTLPLVQAANALIKNMGLLFVPAGVGVIAQASLLRHAWLPILVGLMVSTLLGLVVTAVVMDYVSRAVEARAGSVANSEAPS